MWIRRDDLIDPLISGNKAYKLFYNLIEARRRGASTLVTCGGAWSNHIHAVAAAGSRFGYRTVGVIRGEKPPKLSATLSDAERMGMVLHFVSRMEYRKRGEKDFFSRLDLQAGESYFIPEGGGNLLGVEGIQLLGEVIEDTMPVKFDQIWVACGTGATFAGLSLTMDRVRVIGVEVLKAGDSILRGVCEWGSRLRCANKLLDVARVDYRTALRESLIGGYHCGGYARYPDWLRSFHFDFEAETGIPLDPVYMVKVFNGLSDRISKGEIPIGSRILVLHSGGLQGRRAYIK
ncbi:1-aminocyclopropane-1-carboxylate deaminase/D-cysteine desulfhydrase [Microbulbifer sp. SSSA002]|uniref:1-aminocyclopropane-1-carboxylate deaminase/D-cysteine desulfhydrase n=1 Tax=Microbulbifer sp. SSSA002 TaxID=3243376 RepID=UPI00403A341A